MKSIYFPEILILMIGIVNKILGVKKIALVN